MSDLHELLDRATDAVETPRLAGRALVAAKRRRARRRVAAAVAAAGAAATIAVVVHVVGGQTSSEPAPAGPTGGPTTPSAPTTPTGGPTTTPVEPFEVQGEWDARSAAGLPPAPDSLAPDLPDTIEPPASSPLLADDPVSSVVLAVENRGAVQVLGSDGAWRTLPSEARYPVLAVSPEGTRVALYDAVDGESGVMVHDVATGDDRAMSAPDGYRPWDYTSWTFLDEDTLLLDDAGGGFLVDATTGEAERVPYPDDSLGTAVDRDGALLAASDFGGPAVLTDWSGGRPREVDLGRIGHLTSVAADGDTVACTSYDQRPFSVYVADRESMTPEAVLPVVNNYQGIFANGGLRVLTVADDGTVLLRVTDSGRDAVGFHVVAWQPDDGTLSLVSTSTVNVSTQVAFADRLVGAVG